MKKLALLSILIFCCFIKVNAQGFGSFASAVYLTKNGSFAGYNTTGTGVNLIGSVPFSGSLGSFAQGSGELILSGGETKSFKGNPANVCGSTLFYRVYPTGTRAPLSYTPIDLPYKAGCSSTGFDDGYGPCTGNDQKWNTTTSGIDLTGFCPGNYTIDVYYRVSGSNTSATACNQDKFIGFINTPSGSMNFTITGTAPTITGNTSVCAGDTAKLTASGCCGGAGTITWSNGATGPTLYAAPGSYTATCTMNGCIGTVSDTVVVTETVVTSPVVTVGATSCPAGTATLTATGCCGGDVNWSTGETGTSITAPSGAYSATCSVNGCVSKPSCPVVVAPCPSACPMSGNLLVNGSFEDAPAPGYNWEALTQPGWNELTTGNGGLIETWSDGTRSKHAEAGKQFIELNYLTLGTIQQDVDVTPYEPLTLVYNHMARGASGIEMVRAEVIDLNTNEVIDTLTSTATDNWQQFKLSFTPTSGKIGIRFISLNASNNGGDSTLGNFLDNVTLNYSSCICSAPFTVAGDTTICGYENGLLTASGCAGGTITWSDDLLTYPAGANVYTFLGTEYYVASCVIPGCPDTMISPRIQVLEGADCNEDSGLKGVNTTQSKAINVSLAVSPNPVMDMASVTLTGFKYGTITLQISNVNGSVIKTLKLDNTNSGNLMLDMSAYNAGMYFIKAQQGNKIAVTKVVKK